MLALLLRVCPVLVLSRLVMKHSLQVAVIFPNPVRSTRARTGRAGTATIYEYNNGE